MFPTRGAIAPLADYAGILSRHDGWLVVDESHAFGTLGDRGRGAVEHAGLPRRRVVAGGSMAKAFGAQIHHRRISDIDAVMFHRHARTAFQYAAASCAACSVSPTRWRFTPTALD